MIRVNAATEYAIRSLVYMSDHEGSIISAAEIATALNISKNYLRSTMHVLRKLGFVDSVPGKYGRFILKGDPKQIKLLDVMSAVEGGTMAISESLDICKERGDVPENGTMAGVYMEMQRMMETYLRGIDIEMLGNRSGKTE